MQRIFKQYPEGNAVIELNNLLATKKIVDITEDDVRHIERKYSINLNSEFRLNLEEFYAVYFNYALRNGRMSNIEKLNIERLKRLLSLSDDVVQKLNIEIGRSVYRKFHAEAIADGFFTESDKLSLRSLAADAGLSEQQASIISEQVRIERVRTVVNTIIKEERFSPSDEAKLLEISKNLEVTLQFDKESSDKLSKLKLYWSIENDPLPIVPVSIILQKNEVCHRVISKVSWLEMRTVRSGTSYTGYSTNIKIAKGFYLKGGSFKTKTHTNEQLKPIDSGTLYVTNKRLLFIGQDKNHNIRYEKIVEFTPYRDGIEVGKETGKSIYLKFADRIDIISIMMGRLLSQK